MASDDDEVQELRRIATFFHSILDHLPDVVFVKDAATLRHVFVNRMVEQVLGVSSADMLGKTDDDFFPREVAEFFRAKDREAIERGEVVEVPDERLRLGARGERISHTKKIVIHDADGTPRYLVGISHDITAQRTTQHELDMLRAAVAAAVIHDFRSSLQTIVSGLEMLRGRITPDDAAASILADLRAEVAQLSRLSNDMLDATRVAIEDVSIAPEIVDLAALATAIVERFRSAVATHPVELRTPSAVPPVSVDPVRIEQILNNLLDNAVKCSPAGSPITVEIARDAGGAAIRVTDRGRGIAPDDLPHVFDRFYQSAVSRKSRQGLGLGLFIVKGLVRAHGGHVDVESELGRGSVFRVWFPAVT